MIGDFGSVYFKATNNSGDKPGLWISDGTAKGTRQLTDNISQDSPYATLGNKCVHLAADGSTLLAIEAKTGKPIKLITLSDRKATFDLTDAMLVASDGRAYFAAEDADGKSWFWTTDGTALGTTKLKVSAAGAFATASSAGKLYYFALSGDQAALFEWDMAKTTPKKLYTVAAEGAPPYFSPAYTFQSEKGLAYFIDYTKNGVPSLIVVNESQGSVKTIDLAGNWAPRAH